MRHVAFANDEDMASFTAIVLKARQPCPGSDQWVANQWCPGAADARHAPPLPADGANLALRVGMEVNGGGYRTNNVGADLATEHGLYTQFGGFGSRPDLFVRYYGIVFFEEEVHDGLFPIYSASIQHPRDGAPRPLRPAPACDPQVHGAFDGLLDVERPLISPVVWDMPPGQHAMHNLEPPSLAQCYANADVALSGQVILPAIGQLYEECIGGDAALAIRHVLQQGGNSRPDRARHAHMAVATWAVPMLKGLVYMHDTMGMGHGDLKPEQARAHGGATT